MSDAPSPEQRQLALRQARQQFQNRFDVLASAYSTDGRTFAFQAPLSAAFKLGSYVRMHTLDGRSWLGQILEQQIESREGPEVRLADEGDHDLAQHGISVSEATIRLPRLLIEGSGVVLMPLDADSSGNNQFVDAEISHASRAEIGKFLHQPTPTLPLGSLSAGNETIPAGITASGFNRHTFLCGQSGSGKTYSLGVVIEQLLLGTDLRIAIIDPNADYVKLGSLRDTEHPDERAERYLDRVQDLRVFRPDAGNADASQPLRIRFSDLSPEDQARTLRLDPLADRDEFDAFWSMVARAGQTHYQLQDLQRLSQLDLSESTRQVLLRISNLGVANWGIWADAGQESLLDVLAGDWRSLVLDVSRFERPAERSVVALATLRHFWRQRESRNPVLLVVDEAHNVCPKEPADSIQEAATDLMISIAGEGRKYGIYLFLSTQRPDKLHPNVLSQCDNLMLMRMNSHADIEDLANVFSFVPTGLLQEASTFRLGEALLAGKIVPSPLTVKIGARLSQEGGVDVPTTWTVPTGA